MNWRVVLHLAFTASLAAGAMAGDRLPPALLTDSLGPSKSVIQATHCTITDVEIFDRVINVSFTGRWSGNLNSRTDSNGFTINRDAAISAQTWEFLASRLAAYRGKLSTITVTTKDGLVIRGGIPLLSFPADRFEIRSAASE